MAKFVRIAGAIAPLLLLTGCLLTPGRFVSTLDIRKDGTFSFTYKGEVVAADFGDAMKGLGKPSDGGEPTADKAVMIQVADGDAKSKRGVEKPDSDAEKDAKLRAIADALSKEKGYRVARYIGNNRFEVDYAMTGRLDHSFLFPFNIDAQAVLPFVAVEVRSGGKVRVQAPAFGNESSRTPGMGDMPGAGGGEAKDREGTFTLTTDAEIVSQNEEGGATPVPGGRKIVWKITPLTRTAPMAVLQLVGG